MSPAHGTKHLIPTTPPEAALARSQAFLARLLTEPAAMAAFAGDPLANGQAAGLEVSEVTELAQRLPQLQLFARSLVNKRRRIARRILPLSAAALDGRFDEAFDRYAAMPLDADAGAGKYRQDAWLFAGFLLEELPRGKVRTMVRYERFALAPLCSPRRWGLAVFGAPMWAMGGWVRGHAVRLWLWR